MKSSFVGRLLQHYISFYLLITVMHTNPNALNKNDFEIYFTQSVSKIKSILPIIFYVNISDRVFLSYPFFCDACETK